MTNDFFFFSFWRYPLTFLEIRITKVILKSKRSSYEKVSYPYHEIHKIKPACDKGWFFFFCRFKNSVGICQGISSHYSMSDTFTLTCISNSFGWLFLAVVMATVSTAISISRAQPPSYIFRLSSSNKAINTCGYICIRSPSGLLCLLALLSTWLPSFLLVGASVSLSVVLLFTNSYKPLPYF